MDSVDFVLSTLLLDDRNFTPTTTASSARRNIYQVDNIDPELSNSDQDLQSTAG